MLIQIKLVDGGQLYELGCVDYKGNAQISKTIILSHWELWKSYRLEQAEIPNDSEFINYLVEVAPTLFKGVDEPEVVIVQND